MANKKKEYYKPGPMTEGKRNIVQGLLVPRFSSTPMRFHICSYRYRGMASTYFFISTSVTTEGGCIAVCQQGRRHDRLEHL